MNASVQTTARSGSRRIPGIATIPAADAIEADVVYLAARSPAPRSIYRAGSDTAERTGQYQPYRVTVHDARPLAGALTLDREGFVLLHESSAVKDFYDDAQVRETYYREIERLVRSQTGAQEVVVFDHTFRVQRSEGDTIGHRAPVTLAHNDYTHKSGAQRVRDLLDGDDAQRWLAGRVAEYNVWRPIRGPVRSMPLAVCDAASVAPDDLVAVDLVYPDRVGEVYNAVHNPAHRWYYVPEMRADEALLFKGYDSKTDGRSRFTLHTAIDLPATTGSVTPRESIETRALAYFG
jgi:hypothetical protein